MSPSEPGYVYLLINASMPGLVKVGRTVRHPGERLRDLSSATGVPTPFELVYDVLVPNAVEAESFLHEALTSRGYRLTENREFFRAPIREVVRLMINLREAMESDGLVAPGRQPDVASDEDERDPLFGEAAVLCMSLNDGVDTAVLQRRLKIGYSRAARLIEQLLQAEIIGMPGAGRAKHRIMAGPDELMRMGIDPFNT